MNEFTLDTFCSLSESELPSFAEIAAPLHWMESDGQSGGERERPAKEQPSIVALPLFPSAPFTVRRECVSVVSVGVADVESKP